MKEIINEMNNLNPLYSQYRIGEILYLKTDGDKKARILIGIQFTGTSACYRLACGTSESWHFDVEISREKEFLNY